MKKFYEAYSERFSQGKHLEVELKTARYGGSKPPPHICQMEGRQVVGGVHYHDIAYSNTEGVREFQPRAAPLGYLGVVDGARTLKVFAH